MSEPAPSEEPKSAFLIWTIVLIVVVILAIAGLRAFLPKKTVKAETVEYNGFVFTKIMGSWETQWQKGSQLYDVSLRYNPYEAENISISGKLNSSFSQPELYITFDPSENNLQYTALAVSELSLNIARGLDKKLTAGCTKPDEEGCKDRPIVTCADSDKAVISVEVSNQTEIILDNNCVRIKGKDFELTRAVDRIIYQWFRIMK